jgi:hypothetical protein
MSSSSDDVLGLRGEVEQLRAAINGLRNDLRVSMRTQGRRLSGVNRETGRARQDAVEALANAVVAQFGAPDAQEPPTLQAEDEAEFLDSSEELAVGDETEPAPELIPRGASLLRFASLPIDVDAAGSQPPSPSTSASSSEASSVSATPSSAASSAYTLPFHQTLEEAAREHADAACGDASGERAEVVNEVIRLVEEEKQSVNADKAREHLNDALVDACAARARGILEDALLDAQSLRERVKMLARSINH